MRVEFRCRALCVVCRIYRDVVAMGKCILVYILLNESTFRWPTQQAGSRCLLLHRVYRSSSVLTGCILVVAS